MKNKNDKYTFVLFWLQTVGSGTVIITIPSIAPLLLAASFFLFVNFCNGLAQQNDTRKSKDE